MATWKNDPDHSHLGFVVRHLMITDINGRFADVDIDVDVPGDNLGEAVFSMTAKAASIDTHVHARDEHLRSADFFDVAQHQELSFQSTGVRLGADKTGTITEGKPKLVATEILDQTVSERVILEWAGNLAALSSHPVSKAISTALVDRKSVV